ncbi:hypothetical protein FDT66_09655 [Polaribacter aestuariivivens]|uniref:Lipocalin-like domain-containing protein n=1 Tax=Polaribacter aestuariivivens TaxID=2304626 RepID=A0A5S3N2F6_9FLAO|nr:DUF6265 family protein [Polaribacter aestuariivivens]TMM29383.1 hypothetical protein FDT66_09655 [Polaribacter aestuariivivens]
MKYFLLICSFLLIISCKTETENVNKPTFIIGKWIRLNDKEGYKTYENWNTNFTGVGYTLKNKDTTFKEIMSIVSVNDTFQLKVEGVNETATFFKFTSQTDTSFVCENAQNEFPTKIKYYIENKQLKAFVSNDDFSIDFVFESVK